MTLTTDPSGSNTDLRRTLATIVRAPVDPWTYRSLAYLLLAFPLAIGYIVVLTTSVSLSIGLSITLLGPVMIAMTILLVLGLAWFEGALTNTVLETNTNVVMPPTDDGLVEFGKQVVFGQQTWLGLMFLMFKILLGFVGFIAVVVGVSLATSLVFVPFFYGEHMVVTYWGGQYVIDSLGPAIITSIIGVVVLYLTLIGVFLLGELSALVADALLASSA